MSSLGKLQFALRGKKGGGNSMENILLIGLLILNLIIVGVLIYQNFMKKKEKYMYGSELIEKCASKGMKVDKYYMRCVGEGEPKEEINYLKGEMRY